MKSSHISIWKSLAQVALTLLALPLASIQAQTRNQTEADKLAKEVFEIQDSLSDAKTESDSARKSNRVARATELLAKAKVRTRQLEELAKDAGPEERKVLNRILQRYKQWMGEAERTIVKEGGTLLPSQDDQHFQEDRQMNRPEPTPIEMPRATSDAYRQRLQQYLTEVETSADAIVQDYSGAKLEAKFRMSLSTNEGQATRKFSIGSVAQMAKSWPEKGQKMMSRAIQDFDSHLRNTRQIRSEERQRMEEISKSVQLFRTIIRTFRSQIDGMIPYFRRCCELTDAAAIARNDENWELSLAVSQQQEKCFHQLAEMCKPYRQAQLSRINQFSTLTALRMASATTAKVGIPRPARHKNPNQLPSASSTDLSTGITTTSQKNADGTRTVTEKDRNGRPLTDEQPMPKVKGD